MTATERGIKKTVLLNNSGVRTAKHLELPLKFQDYHLLTVNSARICIFMYASASNTTLEPNARSSGKKRMTCEDRPSAMQSTTTVRPLTAE